jgi:hypothetical protein
MSVLLFTANRAGTNGGANEHATKTITVTETSAVVMANLGVALVTVI